MFLILASLFVAAAGGRAAPNPEKSARKGRDSYLDAYRESHGGNADLSKVKSDRESHFPSGSNGGFPEEHFGAQYPYPSHQLHGPPGPSYGSPGPSYGPPGPSYGPPEHSYGPPHSPHYYPPSHPLFEITHALLGFFEKFKLKLELLTILKILLKVVLFKKFISFIAIICLLLFIPWFKDKKIHHESGNAQHDEEDDDDRTRVLSDSSDRLNNLTVYVLEAIDHYRKQASRTNEKECDSLYCKVNRIAKNITDNVTSNI